MQVKLTIGFEEFKDILGKLYDVDGGINDCLIEKIYEYVPDGCDSVCLKDLEVIKEENVTLLKYTTGFDMTLNNWKTKFSLSEIINPRKATIIDYMTNKIFDNFTIWYEKFNREQTGG